MFYKFDLLILDLTFATDLDFYKELFFTERTAKTYEYESKL